MESEVQAPLIYGKALMLSGELGSAEAILEQVAQKIEKTKGPFIKMIVVHHLSELAWLKGDLYHAEELLKQAHQFGIRNHWENTSAFYRICIDIGRMHYERANFTAAGQLLIPAVQGASRSMIAYDILDGYLALFGLYLKKQNLSSAKRIILDVEYLAKKSGIPAAIMSRVESMLVRISIREHDFSKVYDWLQNQETDFRLNYGFHNRYEAYTAIEGYISLNETEKAKKLVVNFVKSAEEKGWGSDIIKCYAWLASLIIYREISKRHILPYPNLSNWVPDRSSYSPSWTAASHYQPYYRS